MLAQGFARGSVLTFWGDSPSLAPRSGRHLSPRKGTTKKRGQAPDQCPGPARTLDFRLHPLGAYCVGTSEGGAKRGQRPLLPCWLLASVPFGGNWFVFLLSSGFDLLRGECILFRKVPLRRVIEQNLFEKPNFFRLVRRICGARMNNILKRWVDSKRIGIPSKSEKMEVPKRPFFKEEKMRCFWPWSYPEIKSLCTPMFDGPREDGPGNWVCPRVGGPQGPKKASLLASTI